ncbi:MAG: hypothetical protein V2B18_08810 [Pseudomonadota bacterium]
MNQTEMPQTEDAAKAPKSLRPTIIAALCLFVLDSVVLHQLSMAMMTVLALVFRLIPMTLYHAIKGNRGIAVIRAQKVLVYLVTVTAIFISFNLNNRLAEQRAEGVIGAIDKFHDQRGHYPKSLQELVPEYLEVIPRANFTLTGGRFDYFSYGDAPSLMYYSYWPFARRHFNFKGRKWYIID